MAQVECALFLDEAHGSPFVVLVAWCSRRLFCRSTRARKVSDFSDDALCRSVRAAAVTFMKQNGGSSEAAKTQTAAGSPPQSRRWHHGAGQTREFDPFKD